MPRSVRWCLIVCAAMLAAGLAARAETRIEVVDGRYRLVVAGQPFPVKGVGGLTQLELAAKAGANSLRTWGADDLDELLDRAHAIGLKVTVGIWLGHERHGFDYTNVEMVAGQYEKARAAIERYKGHPAVLMWSIGNEMEGFGAGDNAAIWSAVNNIAALAKRLDPTRPTMTVIAELGGERVAAIHRLCPDIDIVGINSYAGAPSIPERYRRAGGTKPYLVTEFGPPGTWEVARTDYGALIEPTSTAKAESYRAAAVALSADPLCLGHYAFKWGHKQEATATWFGMMLPDGSRLGAVEVMQEIWSGRPPANRAPRIRPIRLEGPDTSEPGGVHRASVEVSDPDNDRLSFTWELHLEPEELKVGGDAEPPTPSFPEAILKAEGPRVEFKLPEQPGVYRLFVFVGDGAGNAATASTTLLAAASRTAPATPAAPAAPVTPAPPAAAAAAGLPVVVYADGVPLRWVPAGWMGNTAAIKVDPAWEGEPRSGRVCFRVDFTAVDGFGGIAWQSPANDWGDVEGGISVVGAKRLTFYARGGQGGEQVEFKFGILDRSKRFPDSASGGIRVTLTPQWKQYSIDLDGLDLSSIKTGFVFTVAGQGRPITFFLDDIKYE